MYFFERDKKRKREKNCSHGESNSLFQFIELTRILYSTRSQFPYRSLMSIAVVTVRYLLTITRKQTDTRSHFRKGLGTLGPRIDSKERIEFAIDALIRS